MTMFHIQYPESKTFLTWDELGCLCRALGFPKDLFRDNFPTDIMEIVFDERGISVTTILRLFELNLMFKALHRTFNLHTADWNACVITRAMYMLGHKVLDFEGIHNVRVAYMMYEHIDMKGMLIDRHILLRTLKMCGRTIAPLKLMHRIKHMKAEFEEKGRIQLYEFFNLILWCDLYTAYTPEDMESATGKEEDLYRLVDFHRLLSHYDERVAKQLNEQYLKEEWDFGMECLGSKALYHKQNYRHLKNEVGQSQKRVYRAHAGSVRSRPISAPDLDKYRQKEEDHGRVDSSAQAAYESVQRRLHSAPSKASSAKSSPDRLQTKKYVRCETPQVVTPRDLDDMQRKMENLQFDINTLDSRCQLQIENEMQFYLPGYMEKLADRKPVEVPLPEPEKKQRHWTSKIINGLAYPPSNLQPAHAKNCDARYRGWRKANTRPGYHFVVTSHTHENSEKGRMFSKLEQTAMAPVQYMHPEYVLRYTSKKKALENLGRAFQKGKPKPQRQPMIRFRSLEKGGEAEPNVTRGKQGEESEEVEKQKTIPDLEFFHNKYLNNENTTGAEGTSQPPTDTRKPSESSNEKRKSSAKQSFPRSLPPKKVANIEAGNAEIKPGDKVKPWPSNEAHHDVHPDAHMKGHVDIDWPEDIPVPHMDHTGPKLVGVGQIGTISLLESIEESRDLEDKFVKSPTKETIADDVFEDESIKAVDDDNGVSDDDEDDLHLILHSSPRSPLRWSKSQPSSQQKRRLDAQRRRKSQSAPSARSGLGRKGSPRKRGRQGTAPSSAHARTRSRVVSETTSHTRDTSTGTARTEEDESTLNDTSVSKDESSAPYVSTSYSNTNSSPPVVPRFKNFNGSVTSEESGGIYEGKQYGGHDDQSLYSDEMTLASSMGMIDLPESPIMRKPVRAELADSVDSKRFSDLRMGPRIQFELLDDTERPYISSASSSLEVSNPRRSTNSERKDSIRIIADYREYLSDSEVKKKTFSKETRSRLVGRMADTISPDLKFKLMAGDPGISIPAS